MKNKIRTILLLGGTVLFYVVFFEKLMGLNSLLFSAFILGSTAFLFPRNFKRPQALAAGGAVIFSAAVVFWHSSAMAIFVWVSSLILYIPMVQYPKIRSVHWAGLTALIDYITVFDHLKAPKELTKSRKTNRFYRFLQNFKLAIIPIIVLIIFFALFKEANPVFDELTTKVFTAVSNFISEYLGNISWLDFLFILWAFISLSWMLLKKRKDYIAAKEQDFKDTVSRVRKKQQKSNYLVKGNLKPKLKNEFRAGMLLMVLVNALLLTVNIIDIDWVWLNFEYEGEINLTQFVHEGTYLLILSILISMGIILYFFRKNLNFYPGKQKLQIITYIWIAQNAVLAVSVALRNMHYINEYGLAYKRIGVFFFLTLVIFGLISLAVKVSQKKSLFYLLKVNSWAVWIGFLLFAVPDWDIIIAEHNISGEVKQETDLEFLMQLDEKAFPVIDANMDNLKNRSRDSYFYRHGYTTFEAAFYAKAQEFMSEYKKRSFLEFNIADQKSHEYLHKKYGSDLLKEVRTKSDTTEVNKQQNETSE